MDDTVQIQCPRCKANFREKARMMQAGHSKQCPQCECLVFFEDSSPHKSVQKALRDARQVRRQLRLKAEEIHKSNQEPFQFGR